MCAAAVAASSVSLLPGKVWMVGACIPSPASLCPLQVYSRKKEWEEKKQHEMRAKQQQEEEERARLEVGLRRTSISLPSPPLSADGSFPSPVPGQAQKKSLGLNSLIPGKSLGAFLQPGKTVAASMVGTLAGLVKPRGSQAVPTERPPEIAVLSADSDPPAAIYSPMPTVQPSPFSEPVRAGPGPSSPLTARAAAAVSGMAS